GETAIIRHNPGDRHIVVVNHKSQSIQHSSVDFLAAHPQLLVPAFSNSSKQRILRSGSRGTANQVRGNLFEQAVVGALEALSNTQKVFTALGNSVPDIIQNAITEVKS